jgi:hypothetical protein
MEDSEDKPTNYVGLIIFIIALPLFVFFGHIGKDNLGYNVGFCLATVIIVVMICWDLRFKVWFWTVIAILLLLHIPLLMKVRWPEGWVPWVVLFPIGLADGLVYLGVIKLVEKVIGGDQSSDEDAEK